MTKKQKIIKFFLQKNKLTLQNKEYVKQVNKYTHDLLEKDVTSDFLIRKNKIIRAAIYSKEKGIAAGLSETIWFLNKNKIKTIKYRNDGDLLKANEVLLELKGKIKDILKTERIALNLLQRMSGIATLTWQMDKKIKHRFLICSTRKTIYGLLDKKAVICGGGGTHRLGLNDFILIKDNHLNFLNNKIAKQAKLLNNKKIFWEIEVKDKAEALAAACLEPAAIMLDNIKPRKIKKIIALIKRHYPQIIFEASGNINLKNIKKYRKCDVDIVSLGSLTHSVKAIDMSLDIL